MSSNNDFQLPVLDYLQKRKLASIWLQTSPVNVRLLRRATRKAIPLLAMTWVTRRKP